MAGDIELPDWLLSQFAKQRKRARAKYINFVREGIGFSSIWDDLQKQIFLGGEAFIQQHPKAIEEKKVWMIFQQSRKEHRPNP